MSEPIYVLYALSFDSPVHFGQTENGGSLVDTGAAYRSDQLFSALYMELAREDDKKELTWLMEKTGTGALRFSSLFPWQEQGDEIAYYLPRPLLRMPRNTTGEQESYQKVCRGSTQRKRAKKLKYLRASSLISYLHKEQAGETWDEYPSFGESAVNIRVNCRGEEPRPYFVGAFSFRRGAGLYLIARVEKEEEADRFAEVLEWLGYSGIGGKRSSGYGKFHLADDPLFLYDEGMYKDDSALYAMLMNEQAPWQMTVSTVLPAEEALPDFSRSYYRLQRIGGFVTSAKMGEKKASVTMLDAGSCFPKRFPGQMAMLGSSEGHPVYRYGYGLFLGVEV